MVAAVQRSRLTTPQELAVAPSKQALGLLHKGEELSVLAPLLLLPPHPTCQLLQASPFQ